MTWLSRISFYVRSLFSKRKLNAQLSEEIRTHVEMATEAHVAAGMSPEEARYAALREFGNVANIQEQTRDEYGWMWLEQCWQDLRFSVRALRKNWTFTAVAMVTLALGIGATTAIFGVIKRHVLTPVPGEDERRLVQINNVLMKTGRLGSISAWHYQELVQRTEVFDKLTILHYSVGEATIGGLPEKVSWCEVAPEFFDFFGGQPAIGRWLTTQETTSASNNLIVISHAWWQSRFGGDPNIVGQEVTLGDMTCTIIGVMPPRFQFPYGNVQFWCLLRFNPAAPAFRVNSHTIFARLRPGVSLVQAQVMLDTVSAHFARESPQMYKDYVIKARPVRDFFISPEESGSLWIAAWASGCVLLIVCANLANLQLVRAESRVREIAVRSALGATSARVIRLLLTESLLLSALGGTGGLLLALWLGRLLERLVPDYAPKLQAFGFDGTMLAWAFGASLVCGMAFGLFPAWRAADIRLNEALKDSGQGMTAGVGRHWFRRALVVAQVALAVVLLAGAGLLIRSIVQLLRHDPGFDPTNLVMVRVDHIRRGKRTAEQEGAMTREIVSRLAALAGTQEVGARTGFIGGSGFPQSYYIPGKSDPVVVINNSVSTGEADFFHVVGARLKEGRWFEPSDDQPGQHGVILNEKLAALCWPGESAVGKRLYSRTQSPQAAAGSDDYCQVTGVVRDFVDWTLGGEALPICFVPLGRSPRLGQTYWVRTSLDRVSLRTAAQQISKEVIPGALLPEISWIQPTLYASTAKQRTLTSLFAGLAGVGLFLSMLGVFGVILHAVIRRTKEIGIRLALGAQRSDVLTMVLVEGLSLVGIGLLIGLAGALALTRLISGLLFGITPTDPIVFSAVVFLLLAVALLACYLPARRASQVDAMVALRSE